MEFSISVINVIKKLLKNRDLKDIKKSNMKVPDIPVSNVTSKLVQRTISDITKNPNIKLSAILVMTVNTKQLQQVSIKCEVSVKCLSPSVYHVLMAT